MQDADAEWRLKALRGQSPVQRPNETVSGSDIKQRSKERPSKKRRRMAGEDDTDRDIRFAREDNEQAEAQRKALKVEHSQKNIPLTDARGHVNLFPVEQYRKVASKNQEAEKEEKGRKKGYEDQCTMRFSNAAGYDQSVQAQPWYSSRAPDAPSQDIHQRASKDFWGNEDPGRSQREKMRLSANDPLMMMQQGVKELRKSERDRQKWNDERMKELNDLKVIARQERKERKRYKGQGHVSHLSLSRSEAGDRQPRRDRHHHHHRRHQRHRSLSRDSGIAPAKRSPHHISHSN